jgi:hypothetical protein
MYLTVGRGGRPAATRAKICQSVLCPSYRQPLGMIMTPAGVGPRSCRIPPAECRRTRRTGHPAPQCRAAAGCASLRRSRRCCLRCHHRAWHWRTMCGMPVAPLRRAAGPGGLPPVPTMPAVNPISHRPHHDDSAHSYDRAAGEEQLDQGTCEPRGRVIVMLLLRSLTSVAASWRTMTVPARQRRTDQPASSAENLPARVSDGGAR